MTVRRRGRFDATRTNTNVDTNMSEGDGGNGGHRSGGAAQAEGKKTNLNQTMDHTPMAQLSRIAATSGEFFSSFPNPPIAMPADSVWSLCAGLNRAEPCRGRKLHFKYLRSSCTN